MPLAPLIEAEDVVRRYGHGAGAVTALDRINFRIETGEFVAVTGPSGSGKSTLLNLVGLLDAPTAGVLQFRGQDVAGLSPSARARLRNRHIGFVFQAYHLLSRHSARRNVELPLLYAGIPLVERQRRASAALERVDLSDRAEALPAELSGGEQQRVAIARALVAEPELVVADEPTGALDSRTSANVLALLEGIRSEGRTLILVTHNREIAARATRIIAIADGQIAGDQPGTSF